MKVILEIQRYDPEKNSQPYFQSYEVETQPEERLLTVLMRIKRESDPSLVFRKSCAHGVCGSDAMVVNGRERLACKTLIKDVVNAESRYIRIEPLHTLPLQRDLMVDQTPFFQKYMRAQPFLINPDPPPADERRQSPEERKFIDEGTSCILCAACYSACPVIRGKNPDFLGPAAVIQAARFLADSRDKGFAHRLPDLDQEDGIWPCENFFECTRVCPRNIKITKTINRTKRDIEKFKKKQPSEP